MYETPERLDPMLEGEPGELRVGLVVSGTYRVLERLGTGGMADVYEAEHLRLGNHVALKILRTGGRGDRPGIERFRHEARRVAALTSEHVVRVFDCGELPNGTPYLVMERLVGEDLRSLLAREGPLPVRRAVELAIGACRGLSAVHTAGLVHRDLKPANLFVVRRSDGRDWCKILDFGVAKALISDATASGSLLGTVRYMAPEQLEDASSARATADIYAVGAILYESLTGAPPYAGNSLQELMFRILHHDIVPPSKLRATPVELEMVVLKALSREKTQRYANADAMARALAPFGGVTPRPYRVESDGERTFDERSVEVSANSRRRKRRSPALWMTLGSVVTFASVGLGQGWMPRNEHIARPQAVALTRSLVQSLPSTTPKPVVSAEPKGVLAATPARPEASTTAAARKRKRANSPSSESGVSSAARADRFDTRDPYTE